jgi:hypothetical protein
MERGVDMTNKERIERLERELVEARGWTEVFEEEGAYLAERVLRAEGHEGNADKLAEIWLAAHEASRPYMPAAI